MAEYYDHTLTDAEFEEIENLAHDLHRECEKKRGSIRGQVIQREDSMTYWYAVAAFKWATSKGSEDCSK